MLNLLYFGLLLKQVYLSLIEFYLAGMNILRQYFLQLHISIHVDLVHIYLGQ